ETPVTQLDFLPTFFEIASGKTYKGRHIDGTSFLPLLDGASQRELEERTLYWHFPYYHPEGDLFEEAAAPIGKEDEYVSQTRPQSAILQNGYKLLYFYEDERSELYDLATDPGEQKNLAEYEPELAETLTKDLLKYLRQVNARVPKAQDEQ